MKFIILGRLPSLNEYIAAMNRNRHVGNKMKQECIQNVSWYIKQQLDVEQIKNPVKIKFIWYEANRKRDIDNVSSMGRKVILDALVSTGVLINDTQEWVNGFEDKFYIDKENPRIEVTITEVEYI